MSEETTAAPKKRKKRRKIWNEERRESLILELMANHTYWDDLFVAFKKKQGYRGLTDERVWREAKTLARLATSGGAEDAFYTLTVPPRKKAEKPKTLSVAERRLALIAKHAELMAEEEKNKILEARKKKAEAKTVADANEAQKAKLKENLEAVGAQS